MATSRQKFGNFQEWHEYIAGLTDGSGKVSLSPTALRGLRDNCYSDIEKLRGRPLLVYASNFLGNLPINAPISIDLNDVDGFTDLINSIDYKIEEVDIIIHSPGGAPDATARLVKLLRQRFKKVYFLIPHSAYSAATMLAMSGNSLILHPSASIGPIDPQINGIPARQIKRAFTNLQKRVKAEGKDSIIVYIPLIEKYDLHILEMCDDAEKLSKKLVKEWIKQYMLAGESSKQKNLTATKAVNYMSDFDNHLLHSMPLDIDKLSKYGIHIETADKELKELLREAHILLQATFNGFSFIKIYESPGRVSYGNQIVMVEQIRK